MEGDCVIDPQFLGFKRALSCIKEAQIIISETARLSAHRAKRCSSDPLSLAECGGYRFRLALICCYRVIFNIST